MSVKSKTWMQTAAARTEPLPPPAPTAVTPGAGGEGQEQPEDVHPSRAYGGLWSRRDRAHMVQFRLLDPDKPDEAFDYNYLPHVRWHKGRGEIDLLFETLGVAVVIRGLNLADLKERLCQHLVTWVQEQGSDPVAVRQAQEEARAAGMEFVRVQEIRIVELDPRPDALQ